MVMLVELTLATVEDVRKLNRVFPIKDFREEISRGIVNGELEGDYSDKIRLFRYVNDLTSLDALCRYIDGLIEKDDPILKDKLLIYTLFNKYAMTPLRYQEYTN